MNEEKCIRLGTSKASALLGVPRSELMTAVVSAKFPWLREGEIVWSRTASFRHAMLWIKDGEEPIRLDGKDRISAISSLLVANVGSLPGSLSAADLALAIRQLGEDPRGLLAGTTLLERFDGAIDIWLTTDDDANRKPFLDANTEPVLRTAGDHGWELDFNFFNPKGAVEAWHVEGDHAAIQVLESKERLPDHTFFWPMA